MKRTVLRIVVMLIVVGVLAALIPAAASGRPATAGSDQSYSHTWRDEFDQTWLHALWSWVREDTTHWSLAARPGFLRIRTQTGGVYASSNDQRNLLLSHPPAGDYELTTRVSIAPTQNFQFAAVQVYLDDDNYVQINRGYANGNSVNFDVELGGVVTNSSLSVSATTLYLRITKQGATYSGHYSIDGTDWTEVGEGSADLDGARVGISAGNNLSGVTEIPADFDYVEVKGSFPGFDYNWSDDFDRAYLKPMWGWFNEDPARWSLTARPGFMRIVTQAGKVGDKNALVQACPSGDFMVTTRVLFTPTSNFQIAGLLLYRDSGNYLLLGRAFCDLSPPYCSGNAIYFDHVEGGQFVGSNFVMSTDDPGEAYLRLVREGETYSGYFSPDGAAWVLVGRHTASGAVTFGAVGVTAANDLQNQYIPADFDLFQLEANLRPLQYTWTDPFSSAALDPRWVWVNEDASQWSLSARPGFLRILTHSGRLGERNLLVLPIQSDDFAIETRVLFEPTSRYQMAGLVVYQDTGDYLALGRAFCDTEPPTCAGNGVYFDCVEGGQFLGNFATETAVAGEAHLRIVREGGLFSGFYSADGVHWTLIGRHAPGNGIAPSGIGVATGQDLQDMRIPADFDSFRLTSAAPIVFPTPTGTATSSATPTTSPTRSATPTNTPTPTPTRHHIYLPVILRNCAPVTIELWEQEDGAKRDAALYPLVNEFMAANPNITVEVTHYGNEDLRTQFQTAALAGLAPEIIRCPNDFAGPFSVMGILLPSKDMFDQTFLDALLPGAVAGGVVSGQLWGIPDSSGNHLMLIYNKRLIPTPPGDSDQWIQMAQAATNALTGDWGLVYNTQEPFWLAPFLGGFGGWVLDDVTNMPTLDTPAMVNALQFMQDLCLRYQIVPQGCDYDTADTLFKEGKAAMIINGDWSLSGYAGVAGLDFGTAPIPKIVQTDMWPSPMTSGKYYMISADVKPGTPRFEAVKKFVEFMCGEHAQQVWLEKSKVLPSNINVAQSPLIQSDPILKGSADALSKGRGMPAAPQLRCFWDSARPGQQGVLAGTLTSAEAARQMQEMADRCMQENGWGTRVKVRVGLVTDVGTVRDGTFNQLAYEGIVKALDEFNLENAFIETLTPADYERNIEQLASGGYDLIITVGPMLNDATTKMARKYPDIRFAGVEQDYEEQPPNLAGLKFAEDQQGFLAGCLAGLMTKSNVVGIVAGMEIPPVIKFRKGYENGAKYVNPNVKVLGVYIDSFTDPARGKEAALSQIAEKADVIFGAGGPTGSGAIMGAAAQGVWVIGLDQDEYNTTFGRGSVAGADKLLSSAMKRVDQAVYATIRRAVFGLWQGGNQLFEAKNDGVGLAPYHEAEPAVPQDVKNRLAQIYLGLASGKIGTGVTL